MHESQPEGLDKYFFKGVFSSPSKSNIESGPCNLLDNGNGKEETTEVYWEGKFLGALYEINNSRKKNKLLKEKLINIEE